MNLRRAVLVSSHMTLGDNALRDDRLPEAVYWYWRVYDEAPPGDPRSYLARRLVAGWSSQWMHFRHTAPVTALSLSPDGASIAVGGSDGSLHIWTVDDGTLTARLSSDTDSIKSLRYSHDGSLLAIVRASGRSQVLALEAGSLWRARLHIDTAVRQVAFTPDNAYLVGTSRSGATQSWSLLEPCQGCELAPDRALGHFW